LCDKFKQFIEILTADDWPRSVVGGR